MTDPADYSKIPGQPPSLQDLVGWWGSYQNIPDWAWTEFERAALTWRGLMRAGVFWYPPYRDLDKERSAREKAKAE